MKKLSILSVLLALPMSAFADSTNIRPFVGYNINLASTINSKIDQNDRNVVKSDTITFNDDNTGDFIVGIEIDDIMALSLNAQINKTKTKVTDAGTTTEKGNELLAELDFYLTRNSNFKPFVSLSAGYVSMDGGYKTSGALFGFGIGCRQYLTNNIYLSADLSYNFSTDMSIKQVNGLDVDNVSMHMSGFGLGVSAGYRF